MNSPSFSHSLPKAALGFRWDCGLLAFAALAMAVVFPPLRSMASGGTAFWGSFGEGAGRVECVVYQEKGLSLLLGYDNESRTALYSTAFEWASDESFSFQGYAIKRRGLDAYTGSGVMQRPSVSQSTPSSLLQGSIDRENLQFSAYSQSAATYHAFALTGENHGELQVVLGETECFALYRRADGSAYGGPGRREDDGTLRFLTEEGDVFVLAEPQSEGGAWLGAYALADGSAGNLASEAASGPQGSDGEGLVVTGLWYESHSSLAEGSNGAHFIVHGPGEISLTIRAKLEVSQYRHGWDASHMAIDLLQLGHDERYYPVSSSLPLARTKSSLGPDGREAISLEGQLGQMLQAGTFLIQVRGSPDVDAVSRLDLTVDGANGPKIVNSSLLYVTGSRRLPSRLGVALEGKGWGSLIARNVGPSLEEFEIDNYSANPAMVVFRNGKKSWKNDDWWSSSEQAERVVAEMERVGAFPLLQQSKDAALRLRIEAGGYEIRSISLDSEGYELLEAYFPPVGR